MAGDRSHGSAVRGAHDQRFRRVHGAGRTPRPRLREPHGPRNCARLPGRPAAGRGSDLPLVLGRGGPGAARGALFEFARRRDLPSAGRRVRNQDGPEQSARHRATVAEDRRGRALRVRIDALQAGARLPARRRQGPRRRKDGGHHSGNRRFDAWQPLLPARIRRGTLAQLLSHSRHAERRRRREPRSGTRQDDRRWRRVLDLFPGAAQGAAAFRIRRGSHEEHSARILGREPESPGRRRCGIGNRTHGAPRPCRSGSGWRAESGGFDLRAVFGSRRARSGARGPAHPELRCRYCR